MNTSLISRFFAAVAACLGSAQAAVAQDSIAAETSVWIFSDRYLSGEHELSDLYRTSLGAEFKKKGKEVVVVNRAPFPEGTVKMHNGPDATWPKDVYDKLQAIK
jgi:hypothetical protein